MRKPLAKVEPAFPPMESLSMRVTVRYTPTDIETLWLRARRCGEEVSRYIRRVSLLGERVPRKASA